MAVFWARATRHDLRRIFVHNEEWRGEERAEAIDTDIRRFGETLTPTAGSPWPPRPFLRKALGPHGYWVFFRPTGDDVEVVAVYHAKENWTAILPRRLT